MLHWAAALAVLSSGPSGSVAPTLIDALERAALVDCRRILEGSIKVTDPVSVQAAGYEIEPTDDEGFWAGRPLGVGHVRLGVGSGKPGCRLRYAGPSAGQLYEDLLARLLSHGFVFPDGARKAPEPQFVLDTLVKERSAVGLVSMFRMNSSAATQFAMTMFPPLPTQNGPQ